MISKIAFSAILASNFLLVLVKGSRDTPGAPGSKFNRDSDEKTDSIKSVEMSLPSTPCDHRLKTDSLVNRSADKQDTDTDLVFKISRQVEVVMTATSKKRKIKRSKSACKGRPLESQREFKRSGKKSRHRGSTKTSKHGPLLPGSLEIQTQFQEEHKSTSAENDSGNNVRNRIRNLYSELDQRKFGIFLVYRRNLLQAAIKSMYETIQGHEAELETIAMQEDAVTRGVRSGKTKFHVLDEFYKKQYRYKELFQRGYTEMLDSTFEAIDNKKKNIRALRDLEAIVVEDSLPNVAEYLVARDRNRSNDLSETFVDIPLIKHNCLHTKGKYELRTLKVEFTWNRALNRRKGIRRIVLMDYDGKTPQLDFTLETVSELERVLDTDGLNLDFSRCVLKGKRDQMGSKNPQDRFLRIRDLRNPEEVSVRFLKLVYKYKAEVFEAKENWGAADDNWKQILAELKAK